MSSLNLEALRIDLEMLSDEQFDMDGAVLQAETIISSFETQETFLKQRINCNLHDDYWVLPNETNDGTFSFNFIELRSSLTDLKLPQHLNVNDIILRIKCWLTTHLERVGIPQVKRYYKNLIFIINKTKFFDKGKCEEVVAYLRDTQQKSSHQKLSIVCTALNFLDYNLFDNTYDIYDKAFSVLKFKPKSNTRSLPSATDILIFDAWVDKFYQTEMKKDVVSPMLIRYFPIVIWWKLTSKIPLRPIEFCNIERGALKPDKEGRYYLNLPRKKTNNNNKVQVIDKVLIDDELGYLIKRYLEITEDLGESDTLISWRAIQSVYPKRYILNTNVTKVNPNKLTTGNFKWLLIEFHYEILETVYQLKIPPYSKKKLEEAIKSGETFDIQKHINPGDPRHIAIMTMVAQKFHPIEIARLAGHKSLTSYYHYSNHKEYWVDLEVQKLMMNFHREKFIGKDGDYEKAQILWHKVTERALLHAPIDSKFEPKKKEIGHCTDSLERCFTPCILCNHWRITFEEYMSDKVQKVIRETILNYTKQATNILTDVFNIIQVFDVDEYSAINPEIKNALDEKLIHFNATIQNIAKVKKTEEERVDNGEEKIGGSEKSLR